MKQNMSDEETTTSWGSWEELLLACAIKRHGFKKWDSVAMEIQTKTSLPQLQTTVQCCKQKYQDLIRRFEVAADKDNNNNNYHKVDDYNNNIPLLEEQLRKVRVDELKQEVQRYDLSIHSLQLKVKRLEEEGRNTINSIQRKPDLDDQKTASLDDKIIEPESKKSKEKLLKVSKRGEEESDRENQSVNESNSTGMSGRIVGEGEEALIKDEMEPVRSGGGGCAGPVESESKESESNEELGDSVTQLSSDDTESSASFGRRKRKKDSGDSIKDRKIDVKSEPLIRLLEMIRTHNKKHASMFQRRLKRLESNNYKELIRQHVDLETIRTRVEGGSYYSSCILTFYKDLLLLFNNAIVYFPKASLESETAHQLRNLVLKEIKKETQKSDSSQDHHYQVLPLPPQPPLQPKSLLERSDSLLAKHKSSTPIIVCRKRNSVSVKQSSSWAQKVEQQEQSDDTKKPATDVKSTAERSLLKVITGARSSRSSSSRSLTSNTPPSSSNSNKQNAVHGSKGGSGSLEKQETTPKTEKKIETLVKKKSVVDFLKRIKKNSPVQTGKKSSEGGNKLNGSEEPKRNNSNSANGKKDNSSNKGKERVVLRSSEKKTAKEETSPSKRTVGRPSKKTADTSKASGKRGRESGGKEMVAVKRQRKRARR